MGESGSLGLHAPLPGVREYLGTALNSATTTLTGSTTGPEQEKWRSKRWSHSQTQASSPPFAEVRAS